jgi:aspartate kinase
LIKVLKFGGTSVGSEQALSNLIQIVSQETGGKVLVVSAMSGVTNSLIAWMKGEKPGADSLIENLHLKHTAAVRGHMSPEARKDFETKLQVRLSGLRQAMDRYRDPETKLAAQDAIASWGERLSSLLVASLLRAAGVDAVPITSEEAGIVATGPPGNGTADLEGTARNLHRSLIPLLDAGKVPVLTGYYGVDPAGHPLTFGRGGSDYSGSVVGYALDASVIEIWTDVDGFMTADPRIVKTARTIKEMDYGEAGELAYFGAKVLHPRTIEPARKKGITVLVRNTFNPTGPGTKIKAVQRAGKDLLRSVALKSDLSIVKFYSSEIVYSPKLVTQLLDAVCENGVTTYAISTSLSTLAVAVPSTAVANICQRLGSLSQGTIEKVSVKDGVSLVCAVGDNMINTRGVAAKVFQTAAEVDANIEMISEGASDVALNFLVPSGKAEALVLELHNKFIGG